MSGERDGPLGQKTMIRIVLSIVLVAALGFSAFGVVATFEPLATGYRWWWRLTYGLVGAGCVAGLWRLWTRRGGP